MKPEDLKDANGRWALVKVRIDDEAPHTGTCVMCVNPVEDRFGIPHADIIELLPEVIEVGDRVRHHNGAEGTVLFKGNTRAFICGYGDCEAAWPISDLTLISKGAA